VNSLTFAKNGRSNIAFTEATVLKTTEAAASVASNVATALELLHDTRAWASAKTVRCGIRNGITELSLLVIVNRGRHLYSEGGHHVGHRPTF